MFFNLRRHLRTSSREDTAVSSIYWFQFLFCSYQHHSRFVHLGDPAWVLQKDAGSQLLHWKDERQPSTVSSAAKGLQPSPRLGSVQALRRQELTSIVGDVSLHAGHDVMWLSASRLLWRSWKAWVSPCWFLTTVSMATCQRCTLPSLTTRRQQFSQRQQRTLH